MRPRGDGSDAGKHRIIGKPTEGVLFEHQNGVGRILIFAKRQILGKPEEVGRHQNDELLQVDQGGPRQ